MSPFDPAHTATSEAAHTATSGDAHTMPTSQSGAALAPSPSATDAPLQHDGLVALVDVTPAIVWAASPEGVVDWANASWHAFAGSGRERQVGHALAEVLHPDDRARAASAWADARRTGRPYQIELRLRRADGEYRWFDVQSTPYRDASGVVVRWFGLSTDITTSRAQADALRQSEARYRASFELANIGKMEVDAATGRFVLVNDAYCAIVGWTREELLEMGPRDLVHPDDGERDAPALAAFFSGETSHYSAEKRFVRKDGRIIWVRVNCGLVRDWRGCPLHSVGVLEDITERKRHEAQREIVSGLTTQLATVATLDELVRTTTAALAEHLHVNLVTLGGISADASWGWADVESAIDRPASGVARVALTDLLTPDARADLVAGRPLVVDDVSTDVRTAPGREVIAAAGVAATIVVPLRNVAGLVATLHVNAGTPRRWQQDEIDLLVDVAARLWPAIERIRADMGRRTWEARLRLLARTSERLLLAAEPDRALLESIFSEIAQLIDMESFYHYRLSDDPRLMRLASHGGVSEDEQQLFAAMPFGELLCGRVAESRTRLVIEDLQHSTHPGSDVLRRTGATSYAGFPLVAHGELIGTIGFVSRRRTHLREGDLQMIQAICDQIATRLERARLERDVRDGEERARLALEGGELGSFDIDLRSGATVWSRRHAEVQGYRDEQLASFERWETLIHPDDREGVLAAMDRARLEGTPLVVEHRIRRADTGEERWLAVYGRYLYDEAGRAVRLSGVSRDVTGRRHAEAARQDAARQKDEFIAVLAHELRNPLAPIRTSVRMLREAGPADPILAKCRGIIERQVAHMARLLDDLLDVSRLSRGKLTLQRAVVRLHDVVDAAVETVQPMLDDRGHTLTIAPIDPRLALDGDGARLAQILINLLSNAAKYTDPGGRIDLTVQVRGDQVVVGVRDNGIGLAPGVKDRIFELFAQVEDARHRADGGLGIGLGLTKRLVEMHGGTIAAESDGPGKGTTFTVGLPLLTAVEPGDERTAQSAPPMTEPLRRRVLIVDDNADAADTMALLLDTFGCETRAVYDGEAALREAAAFHPDLVLLDLGMPGLSGQAVCRRLRGERFGANVVIAAVTGWGQDEDRRRTRASGFDHHLVKPVDPEVVARLLREL